MYCHNMIPLNFTKSESLSLPIMFSHAVVWSWNLGYNFVHWWYGILQNLDRGLWTGPCTGLWTGVLTTFTRFLSPFGCLNQASNLEGPGISFIAGSSYLELVSETAVCNHWTGLRWPGLDHSGTGLLDCPLTLTLAKNRGFQCMWNVFQCVL